MKLITLLTIVACLQVSAKGYTQGISLSVKNAPLEKVFQEIHQQAGYDFLYKDDWLQNAKKVSIEAKNSTIEQVLEKCFKNQPLDYTIIDKVITIKPKRQVLDYPNNLIDIRGKVVNEQGEPLEGVTVTVKGTKNATATDGDGFFILKNVGENATLVFSGVNVENYEIKVSARTDLAVVKLPTRVSPLDQVKIIGYGTTTQRFNTGNVTKVTAEEIGREPITNPLAALQGRVAGLTVTQYSGLPGSEFDVQIRGRNSINADSKPLFIVDGVPFSNVTLDRLFGGITGQSPFYSINPTSIESIEVLKDADATAIYGSRGANGVILITTKKGKAGKASLDLNIYSGIGTVPTTLDLMNTSQYISMRREAYRNDNRTPTLTGAPDLLAWDTTRYTDWQKLLIGGTANFLDINAGFSGGNEQTQFLFASSYHRETTVFPGNSADKKSTFRLNVNHRSANKKFLASITTTYSDDDNNLPRFDLTPNIYETPNSPLPYDSLGKVNWEDGGVTFNNPLGKLLKKYVAKTDFLQGNALIQYQLLKGLNIKLNAGYSNMVLDQTAINPKESNDPTTNPVSSSEFARNTFKSWILEPQVEYTRTFRRSKLAALIGTSWQEEITNGSTINASDYASESLLESLSGAATISSKSNYSQYRYTALFGRINYNWQSKYLINLSGRVDGSSKFGPDKRFSTFGAIGAGWIFSEGNFFKKFSFMNYGKLRFSYGITGNDQIGDYKYLNTWIPTVNPYQGSGLIPGGLSIPDYAWEVNRKLEAGIEVGILNNNVLLAVDCFRNRSGNQLLNYILPAQAGRESITKNLPALVQNTGWEFELNTVNMRADRFRWTSSFNLTIAHNKLLKYPNLESSNDASKYVIGESLDIRKLFDYTGVDPLTGLYQFVGTSIPKDETVIKDLAPDFYGGLSNSFQYGNFELYALFQFVKQNGYNYNSGITDAPGGMSNQPLIVLDRWQKQGDRTVVQRFTTGGAGLTAYNNLRQSSEEAITDASFIRFKSISLSFNLPTSLLEKIKGTSGKIYLQGQNLFTVTQYEGLDPENTQVSALPPLRIVTAGVQISF